ncbi:glycosyltransferase [Streptomyces alanosinicus]|uniref:glycosyltransferase n=1 Tax=Streptomyces alanosinicus TaxID=68171 RepID=UPI00167A7D8E|nr:glycosyltransferase [Streptomyces alanosinicus]
MTALPATVAIAGTGTAGDLLPLLAIGRRLVALGHAVTFITHAPYRERAQSAGLRFVALDTEEEYAALLADSAELVGGNHDLDLVEGTTGWYHSPERKLREYQAVADCVSDRDAVVIGRYLSAAPAMAAAEACGARGAWSLVSPHALQEGVATQALHGARKLDALNTDRKLFGLPPVEDWLDWTERVAVKVGLWPDWFAPDVNEWPRLFRTGFPCDASESGALPEEVWEFLSAGEPPVLITGGTGRMLVSNFFESAVNGVLRVGARAIVVNRHLRRPLHWPEGQVLVQPQLPFPALMRHLSAIAHHGGIGTCARALECGVPQVVLAEGVDRPDNAARLRRLGVAIDVPGPSWTASTIADALRVLAETPSVRSASEEAVLRLRGVDAADQAARLVAAHPW